MYCPLIHEEILTMEDDRFYNILEKEGGTCTQRVQIGTETVLWRTAYIWNF